MKLLTLFTAATLLIGSNCLAADNADKDNTGVNKRDADGQTLTSGDQSNSPEDIAITTAIRRAVVQTDTLSTTAKNIKIITIGGAVTLRGPVKSDQEKETIAKLASTAAPKAKITNELEVDKQ